MYIVHLLYIYIICQCVFPWFTSHNSLNEGYFWSQCLWGVTRQGPLSKRIVFFFLGRHKTLDGRERPVYGKHKFWKDHTFWSPAVVFPILVQFFLTMICIVFFLRFCNSYTFPFWIHIIKLILWYIYWKDVVQQKASIKYHILFFEKLNQFGNDVNANAWCLD